MKLPKLYILTEAQLKQKIAIDAEERRQYYEKHIKPIIEQRKQLKHAVSEVEAWQHHLKKNKIQMAAEYETQAIEYGNRIKQLYDKLEKCTQFDEFVSLRTQITILKDKVTALSSRQHHITTPII